MVYYYLIGCLIVLLVPVAVLLFKGGKLPFFSRLGITHNPEWLSALAREFLLHQKVGHYTENTNQWLSELSLPQAELSAHYDSTEELLDELSWILHPNNVSGKIKPLHHNNLPILDGRSKNDALRVLRDTLKKQVPKARWKINRAWRKARRKKLFSTAVAVFWQSLYQATEGKGKTSRDLRQCLADNLAAIITDKSFSSENQYNVSMASVTIKHKSWVDKNPPDPAAWQLVETGLLAGFAFYVHDLDDIPLFEVPAPLDETLDTLAENLGTAVGGAIDWDQVGTISFPILAASKEAHKQIKLLWDEKTNIAEAGLNFTINVSAKASGALVGGWAGKIIGSVFGPAGTVIGGGAGAIFGALLGGKGARKIVTWRYENARKKFEETLNNMETAVDKGMRKYYESIQRLLEILQERLTKDFNRLLLISPDKHPLDKVAWDFREMLLNDLKVAQQWKERHPGKMETTKGKQVNDFLAIGRRLSEELEHTNLADVPKLLYKYRNMPLLKHGKLWKNRKRISKSIRHWNGAVSIGLIGWIYAIQGLYGNAMEKVGKEMGYYKKQLEREHYGWVQKLEVARERVMKRAGQFG